jgi:hypothetical protein
MEKRDQDSTYLMRLAYLQQKTINIWKHSVDMSDPPGHFVLFCKLQKGGLGYAKRSQGGNRELGF